MIGISTFPGTSSIRRCENCGSKFNAGWSNPLFYPRTGDCESICRTASDTKRRRIFRPQILGHGRPNTCLPARILAPLHVTGRVLVGQERRVENFEGPEIDADRY